MPGFRSATDVVQDIDMLVRGTVTTQDVLHVQVGLTGCLRTVPPVEHVRAKLAQFELRRGSRCSWRR